NHEAVAVAGKRARRALRLFIPASAHDAHELESAHDQGSDGGIHASGNHGGEMAGADGAERVSHGVGGRRAARGDDVAESAEAETHGDFAGQRADGGSGDGVYAALFGMAGVEEAILLLGEILRASAGADDD